MFWPIAAAASAPLSLKGGRDGRPSAGLNGEAVESGLRHFPLLLQRLDPHLEIGVELNDALLDRPVKALEPIGSAGNLLAPWRSTSLAAETTARCFARRRSNGRAGWLVSRSCR